MSGLRANFFTLLVMAGWMLLNPSYVQSQSYLEIDPRVLAIAPELQKDQERIKESIRSGSYEYPANEPVKNKRSSSVEKIQTDPVDQNKRRVVQETDVTEDRNKTTDLTTDREEVDSVEGVKSRNEDVDVVTMDPEFLKSLTEQTETEQPVTVEVHDNARSPVGAELALFQEIPMVITASKKLQPVSEAPAAVYVITQEDIKQMGSIHLWDVLRQVPGMDVSATTTAQADVSLRGFNDFVTNKTLVLIDGRSIYSPIQGFQLWESIPVQLEEIERIEVVKGPVAALYGANANLGLINIITKSPEEIDGSIISLSIGTSGGTTDVTGNPDEYTGTQRYSFVHGGTHKDLAYKYSAGWKTTDAIQARTANGPDAIFKNIDSQDALDSFQQNALVRYRIDDESDFAISGGMSKFDEQFMFNDLASTVLGVYPNGVEALIGPLQDLYTYVKGEYTNGNFTAYLYWNYFHSIYETEAVETEIEGDRVEVELRYDLSLGNHDLIIGGGGQYDVVDSDIVASQTSPSYDQRRKSQNNWNFYIQDDYQLTDEWSLNAAGRIDHYSISRFNPSGRLAAIYHPNDKDTYRLAAGYSFRNPTFSDYFLYQDLSLSGVTLARVVGNEFVDPERYITYEASYAGNRWDGRFRPFFDYYWTKVSELIHFNAEPFAIPNPINIENIGDAYSQGFETGYELDLTKNISWNANYAFNNVFYHGNPSTERYYPEKKINSGLKMSFLEDRLTTSIQMHYVWPSSQIVNDTDLIVLGGENARIPSYWLLNAWFGYQLTPDIEISFAGFNLNNDVHREINRGDIHGRRFLGKLEMKF